MLSWILFLVALLWKSLLTKPVRETRQTRASHTFTVQLRTSRTIRSYPTFLPRLPDLGFNLRCFCISKENWNYRWSHEFSRDVYSKHLNFSYLRKCIYCIYELSQSLLKVYIKIGIYTRSVWYIFKEKPTSNLKIRETWLDVVFKIRYPFLVKIVQNNIY